MKAVVQRVSSAAVTVLEPGVNRQVARIEAGLLVLLGVEKGDGIADARYLAQKVCQLRLFDDEEDAGTAWTRAVNDFGGQVLVVSQFTLLADCEKGRRPSFSAAAAPDEARRLYEDFVELVRQGGARVSTGEFQARMQVSLANDGPVTVLLESRRAR
jgi:D-tyrosyl-tRNA(Tyr) deacylase